ncbi:MAG: Nif3-like dinuclear metal center hexameric protein, partial [Planctomycetota bacterium]
MASTGADLVAAIERLAPPALAENWDNVGLLAGDRSADIKGPVLLTIDLTASVMDEAELIGAGAIIAYHPVIFSPIKRLTADDAKQRLVLRAVRAGMMIYSPHTAIDAAPNGLNDWLASG